MGDQVDYYSSFLHDPTTQLKGLFNVSGEHSFLTVDQGSTCLFLGEPYINACGFDAAGDLLNHLYNETLSPPLPGVEVCLPSLHPSTEKMMVEDAFERERNLH